MTLLLSISLQKAYVEEILWARDLHLWYNQQLKRLQTLIGEISNNTPTGMLVSASTEQLRLETRLPGAFKDVPWNKLKNTAPQYG